MNGQLPTTIDLSPFIGQEVISFVVGKHEIELVFTDTRLIVEGGFELEEPQGRRFAFSRNERPKEIGLLVHFLGQRIEDAWWVTAKGLALKFINQMTFIACADGGDFESFSFSLPNEPAIVVV